MSYKSQLRRRTTPDPSKYDEDLFPLHEPLTLKEIMLLVLLLVGSSCFSVWFWIATIKWYFSWLS